MKKLIIFSTIILMCLCLAACTGKNDKTITLPEKTSVTDPVENTTKPPTADSERGKKLVATVLETLDSPEEAEISGDTDYGKFTYRYNRDPKIVYANEKSDDLMKKAEKNANRLADVLFVVYDCEINKYNTEAVQIGSGDNGIDSVQYKFYYKNTQNQILKIYADSDGVISYVDCAFTW